VIQIEDLTISFQNEQEQAAVNHISFAIERQEIVGIVGESGSGKTMTALAIAGLLKKKARISSGRILFEKTDLLTCTERELREYQGSRIGMVFQEPMTSLNPAMKVGKQAGEGLKLHTKLSGKERKQKILDMLEQVEIKNPQKVYEQYPHQLSGGMRQRVMIAMALSLNPDLLIADEPTTALDVTTQAQIIKLLRKRNEEYGTTILFISHNLGVVKQFCHRVIVMKQGEIVEEAVTEELFAHPKEEYTKKLIAAIPKITNRRGEYFGA
jgi:peptide/nickel transport system ATP-binding protein